MLLKEGISPPHYYHKKISINRRESERLKKPVVPLLQLVSKKPIMLAPTQKCAFLFSFNAKRPADRFEKNQATENKIQ